MPPQPPRPADGVLLTPRHAPSNIPTGQRLAVSVTWKSLALPNEHGGWGLLFEPLVLGLVLAPSWAGAALAISALGAFLARHPLRLALADWRRGTRYPRTRPAELLALGYGALALGGLLVALRAATAFAFVPLLAAVPLGVIQLVYDARHQGRQLLPELAGGVALAATAPTLVLLGGWTGPAAACLGLLLAVRVVTCVLYVRARLRAARGLASGRSWTLGAHVAGLLIAMALVFAADVPASVLAAFVVLLARAAYGLLSAPASVRPQVIGFQELGFGALTTLLLALGYAGHLG